MTVSTVDYARETVAGLWDEIQPLLKKQADEVATFKDIPLTPDKELYFKMDASGLVRVFTARKEGRLVGYSLFFVRASIQFQQSIQAQQDLIFIDKEERGFGGFFIDWCDIQLKLEGVQVVRRHVKAKHDWSKILVRHEYKIEDFIYVRRLN